LAGVSQARAAGPIGVEASPAVVLARVAAGEAVFLHAGGAGAQLGRRGRDLLDGAGVAAVELDQRGLAVRAVAEVELAYLLAAVMDRVGHPRGARLVGELAALTADLALEQGAGQQIL